MANCPGPVCECVNHAVFSSYVVMSVHMWVFICICGFSVYTYGQGSVRFWHYDCIQKEHQAICWYIFHCEFNGWISGVGQDGDLGVGCVGVGGTSD